MFLLSAAQLLDSIDLKADPCNDFFQYACGSWNKKHIIPEDKSSYNTFEKLHDELQVKLKSKQVFSVFLNNHFYHAGKIMQNIIYNHACTHTCTHTHAHIHAH